MWKYGCPRDVLNTKIKRTTLIQTKGNGGLNMPDTKIICKSLKVMWVKRLLEEDPLQWKVIPLYYLQRIGGRQNKTCYIFSPKRIATCACTYLLQAVKEVVSFSRKIRK